jgi:cytochrome c peroxidase
MYQKFGMVEDYWAATGSQAVDQRRADVTKNPADRYVFKVPILRNVAMTAPYFQAAGELRSWRMVSATAPILPSTGVGLPN